MSYLLKAFADLRQKACKNPLCILIARDSRAFVSISGAVSGQFFLHRPGDQDFICDKSSC